MYLFSDALEQRFGYGVPHYQPLEPDGPLMLITPSSSQRTNATFGSDPASAGPEVLELHPDDAARHAVGEGDLARVWNGHGEVELRVQLSPAVRPGVAYSPKGTWLATSATGQTVNALLDADVRTDIMDGACYNDTFVDVAPALRDGFSAPRPPPRPPPRRRAAPAAVGARPRVDLPTLLRANDGYRDDVQLRWLLRRWHSSAGATVAQRRACRLRSRR